MKAAENTMITGMSPMLSNSLQFSSNTKPKKYNKVRFTHHFWQDIASGASYASYTSKTLTIGFGITWLVKLKKRF